MNAGSLTELGGALGCHPALRSHANAAHTTHRRDQLAIHVGKERKRVIREGRDIPLNWAAARRLEVQQPRDHPH